MDLAPDSHLRQIIAKATRVAYTVRRTIGYMTKDSGKLLFSSMVRPILEYAAPVWSPYKVKDIKALEKVQRRFTKAIPALKGMSYNERLRELDRGDMLQMYNFFHQGDTWVRGYMTEGHDRRTRGHSFKIKAERARLELRSHFFINRVRKDWNSLPEGLIRSKNIECFKRGLDKLWGNDDTRYL